MGGRGLTSVDDMVDLVEVGQALEHGEGDLADNVDVDGAYALVYGVERALVGEFHADADVWIGEESPPERDDVLGVTVVHDLELAQYLFPHGRLRINEDVLQTCQLRCE